jgi:hypothetical protein
MRYRSLALSLAALSLAPITTADAQSVYVAPGGVYVANGNVYVAPAPTPYGPAAPGVVAPSVYGPSVYGVPPQVTVEVPAEVPAEVYPAPLSAYGASVYAAPPPAYNNAPVYGAPAYGAPVYAAPRVVAREPAYVVRGRPLTPIEAYAAEVAPRPPAPVPYGVRRW